MLANRLSQQADVTVLLIERGDVKDTFISRVPLLSSHFASDGSRSHVVLSAPQTHLDGRQLEIISGNSLGGASKINAMMYTRGLPAEFELWEAMGNEGWGYRDLLPYFMKGEKFLNVSTEDRSACHSTKGKYATEQLMMREAHLFPGEWTVQSHPRRHWWHTDEYAPLFVFLYSDVC